MAHTWTAGNGGLASYRQRDINTPENGAAALSTPGASAILGANYLASTSGSPDITVPIGQVEYQSVISRQTEMSPVSIQVGWSIRSGMHALIDEFSLVGCLPWLRCNAHRLHRSPGRQRHRDEDKDW